ncbi:MAG TPA: ATP-binding protein [Rubricoccaceae bacterium]
MRRPTSRPTGSRTSATVESPPVPTIRETEADVQASILAFFRTGAAPGPDAVDASLAHLDDAFTGIGTGPGDYYPDRDAFGALLRREKEQGPYPGAFEVVSMHVRELRPGLALAEGQIHFEIEAGGQTHVVEPRCSFVLERRGGRWLIAHFHFSMANAMQGEGDSLMDALENRNRQLEGEVAERRAEVDRALAELRGAQARLVHQETMASLGALTAGIAHEIKNPLNFVNNFAGLSRELTGELRLALASGDAAEADGLLDDLAANAVMIETHGGRADAVVRAMMAHGLAGTGERRVVDLNETVAEHVRLAEHECQRAGGPDVAVSIDLDPAVGEVEVVVGEIVRVVVNLLRNALRAVRERAAVEGAAYAPAVSVRTRRTAGGVEVVVEDDGAGMSPAVRARAFEPFFTTRPPGEGTGLGLSLVHDVVVKGHGGTIRLDSEEGRGTAVVFTLPA